MSWGERSCKECKAPEGRCEMHTCNVDCKWYEWDGKTKPDSFKASEVIDDKPSAWGEKNKPDFTGLKFCIRCKKMKSKSHIKKCKKRKKR